MSSEAGGAPSIAARWSDDARGGLLMFASGLLFAAVSAAIKDLAADLPFAVIAVLRNVMGLVCFAPMIWRSGVVMLRTERYFSHFWRGAYGYISFLGFIYVLPLLTLADVIALSFTTPLWSLLLSALFIGERIPASRWLAVTIGFGGVLLIAKPTTAARWATPLALAPALLARPALLKVQPLSRTEPPDRLRVYF